MSLNKIFINNSDTNYTHSIFDITQHTGISYEDLSSALAAVPTEKQSGGMTVRYIQTSDNKYVQYRLMTTSFSTDENDWQSNESLYENNFEYVEAHVDKDRRFLYGVDKENNFIFGCGIPSAIKKKCNYITVDKQGNGDYGTLTGAVANANDGDIIIVMPGVYENESVKTGDKKTLYIIGVDREKCIIKNSFGDYYNPPIQFSGGLIRNITVIAEATTGDSYCVHMDYHNEKNNTIDIENCTFINKAKLGALGIGLRGGCVLTIKNCLVSAPNGGRALYCHDNDYNDAQYEGLQTLKVYDSVLYCPDAAVFIQSQGNVSRDFSVSQYYIEFVRNRLIGNAAFINWYKQPQLGEITEDDFQGVKNLRLSNISWGNSASVLNNE